MRRSRGVVLDAGAFIALERRKREVVALFRVLVQRNTQFVTSAGVVAQVWRGGEGPQFPIAYLLNRTEVVAIGPSVARLLGKILGVSGSSDVVDAHVAYLGRDRGWAILTSDSGDLRAIDPTLELREV